MVNYHFNTMTILSNNIMSSFLNSNASKYRIFLKRFVSNKPKYTANVDNDVWDQFNSGLQHRKHDGRRTIPCVSIPLRLESAAIQLMNKYNSNQFREDVERMTKRAHFLQMPAEEIEIREKAKEIGHQIALKDGVDIDSLPEHEKEQQLEKRRKKIETALKRSIYNWKDIEYDDYASVVYMAARLTANYAALLAVFNGIKKDDSEFQPKSLFDFGSGVGTTIWAANEVWPKAFDEYFCVDISGAMNDLSRLLLQGGKENKKMIYETVFYRQFLPVSHSIKYDLVVSAFSLLEMPDARNRVHVIENLWHKTQDMLVIVEHGSRAGFAAVLEARNLILELSGHKVTAQFKSNVLESQVSTLESSVEANIVSPCPHEFSCPRQSTKGPVLCNFEVTYIPLQFGQKTKSSLKERYSYIVIRKGNKPIEMKTWPRIVQPVLTGHHRAICRFCCSDGNLKEVYFTKSKTEKHTYRCAKISRWGDRFPGYVQERVDNNDSKSNE